MSRRNVLGDEEIKVQTGPGGTVIRIGKDVPLNDAAGESIGIEKIGGEFLRDVYGILEDMMLRQGSSGLFYEAAFQRAIDKGSVMTAVDVGSLQSIEIDTPGDFLAAKDVSAALREIYRTGEHSPR
jgi:choline kinase